MPWLHQTSHYSATCLLCQSALVRPDGTLYYGTTQTMPFARRPPFQVLLGAIDFAVAKDCPARGEYTGELPARKFAF
jgi:hypothetical protein